MLKMKIYNFAAGPAMLPAEVMLKAQQEFVNYENSGSGLMELSHRGKYFKPVIEKAENNVKELFGLDDSYSVLFIQGGASMQFAMIPMNLLNGGTADYVDTGVWSSKAAKEAKMFIDKYYELYPGVKNYMDNIVVDAKQNGFVKTLFKTNFSATSKPFSIRPFFFFNVEICCSCIVCFIMMRLHLLIHYTPIKQNCKSKINAKPIA